MARLEISKRVRQEYRKTIDAFTLFDDTFMTIVFDENPECVEYVLSVILGKNLKVVESQAQRQIKSLRGRSVRLDIKAVDSRGKVYNIEVQREDAGARPRRARYNGALPDASCKDSGKYGEKLPETYIIFITEKDYWKEGLPFYDFERKCTNSRKAMAFEDGLHIIYVNGAYKGKDKIGRLMRDFSCANPDDIKSDVLRRSTARYKKNEQEAQKMCKAMERLNKMAIEDYSEETAIEALKLNLPIDQIQKITRLPEAKIRKLQEEIFAEA